MIHTLFREQWIERRLDSIFPFFERPENLPLITPPELDFQLLTPAPVEMKDGRIIDYTIRVLGRKVRWRTIISTYKPPFSFVDEQLKGPYSFWHHTHTFLPEHNGTRIIDEVRYALPVWLPAFVSRLLNRWYVQPELQRIFNYRRLQFEKIFDSPTLLDTGSDDIKLTELTYPERQEEPRL